MIPAGYLLKRVVSPPEWLTAGSSHIEQVCSVSGCVNDSVADPRATWQHNSFGLADSADLLWSLAREEGADLDGAELFFCEAYELELESDGWTYDPLNWRPRTPAPARQPDAVALPGRSRSLRLLGYDVVAVGYDIFHSPLSCNGIAGEVRVNEHCLFDAFDDAREAIDSGRFGGGCEEGAYTIFAVHRVVASTAG